MVTDFGGSGDGVWGGNGAPDERAALRCCLAEVERLGPDGIDQFDPEAMPTIVYAGT